MAGFSRRTFFGLSAATVGAVSVPNLPFPLRSALAMTPSRKSASAIEHVVVLMQENRSFDHYFGTLRGVRGFDDRSALRAHRDSVFAQNDANHACVKPYLHASPAAIADLDHSWHGTHAAWNDGRCDAWVKSKGQASMAYLDRAAIPFHFALADAFTLCDHYFCSVMGPTNPNRLYLWSGTCDPNGLAGGPAIDNARSGFRWTTYPERLQAAGVDWKIYQNADDNYDDNALAWFSVFQHAKAGSALHERGMASVPRVHGDTCADIVAAIESDVVNGRLPFASWIVAPESCSEHPSHSPQRGADFIARVLAALTADPDVWASTVLLINYDENDGFFDHLQPPVAPPGTRDEFVDGMPIGLGPRVPMLVASPFSRGGHVCSQVFDHTSVIRFMESLTGVIEPNISAWRRRVCGDLMSAFDFTATSVAMSAPPSERRLGLQEAGTRPARALPYQPNANAIVSGERLQLTLANDGAASVHMTAHAHDSDAPRRFDVAAFERVHEAISANDAYDVAVHGPNGFLRHFMGNAAASLDARCEYDFASGAKLRLTLANRGADACIVNITPNAYDNDADRIVPLAASASATHVWDLETTSDGWYDFTVIAGDNFRWRFAGHVELGRASISG
jgi:phospholipase C